MGRLKIGVVGAGIGRAHLRGYQELKNQVEVVALCDLNETRLNDVADQFDISGRYTDYQKLFTSGKTDTHRLYFSRGK